MKNILLIATVYLALTSCKKQATSWDTELGAPLINDTLDLSKLIDNHTLVGNANGTLDLDLTKTILDLGLADIVSIAVHGDFMQALDCLTIIENMPGPFEEHQLLESQLYLKDYLDNRNEGETQKNHFISEIALYIKEQNEGIDADLLFE